MKNKLILLGAILGLTFSSVSVLADNEPDIATKYDITNMSQYDDSQLEDAVSLNKFFVKDLGKDKLGNYHILITPTRKSNQYFLVVTKKGKKLHVGQRISLQGMLNGRGKVNHNQVASGISRAYANKDVVLYQADSYKLNIND